MTTIIINIYYKKNVFRKHLIQPVYQSSLEILGIRRLVIALLWAMKCFAFLYHYFCTEYRFFWPISGFVCCYNHTHLQRPKVRHWNVYKCNWLVRLTCSDIVFFFGNFIIKSAFYYVVYDKCMHLEISWSFSYFNAV